MNKSKLFIVILVLVLLASYFLIISVDDKKDIVDNTDIADDTQSVKSEDLLKNISVEQRSVSVKGDEGIKIADFGLRLLNNSRTSGNNIIISPLSIIGTMSMVSNGAGGKTLEEMESAFKMSSNELGDYLYKYYSEIAEGVGIANAIWFKDEKNLKMDDGFLKKSKEYFGVGVYKSAFDDSTKDDINNWVNEKTNKMIPEILDVIPSDAVVYLVNAISFDKKWTEPYGVSFEGKFKTASNGDKKVKYMSSHEKRYIATKNAKGVIKPFSNGRYVFVGILPNKGVGLDKYVKSLNGKDLINMVKNAKDTSVDTRIPKFKVEYYSELSDVLKKMGILEAFDESNADFKKMAIADKNIFLSRVLHKSFIKINEEGAKAGSATLAEMKKEEMPEDDKQVYLNRPFLYMIFDSSENVPIFIGTVEDF